MKAIVETVGNFMLFDPSSGEEVSSRRPSVVRMGPFISYQASLGQVRFLATELPDEASDIDFHMYWTESGKDTTLAIASYLEALNVNVAPTKPEPKPEPKPEKKSKSSE